MAYPPKSSVLGHECEVDGEVETRSSGVQRVGQGDKVVLDLLLVGEGISIVEVVQEMLSDDAQVIECCQCRLSEGGVACWCGGNDAPPDWYSNL